MNFLFFWRLAREKGFDLILHALENITQKTGELPGNFFLFGEGDLRKELFQTFQDNPLFEDCSDWNEDQIEERFLSSSDEPVYKIYFFGWQSQGTIRDILEVSHFTLMPSRFLETFGLSALESLSEWVPVIGFWKWGLIPFILPELAIPFSTNDAKNVETLASKILEVSDTYTSNSTSENTRTEADWALLSHQSRHIADSYTEERWVEKVRNMFPKDTKKILLASDYVTILGGIETHVQTIARVLRQHGYEVEIFGWELQKGKWTKFLRLLWLVYSLCNITSARGIRKKIRDFQPDVIWLHSVSRFLGPLVIREVNKSGIFSLITYHDLGILSPFPSRMESEDMIPKNPSLRAFLNVIRSRNPIMYLAAHCKYFQVCILRKLLQKVNIHIVPSSFLVPHIWDIIEIPEEKIQVLEHFL